MSTTVSWSAAQRAEPQAERPAPRTCSGVLYALILLLVVVEVTVVVPDRNRGRQSGYSALRRAFAPPDVDPEDPGPSADFYGATGAQQHLLRSWAAWERMVRDPAGAWEHAGTPSLAVRLLLQGTWRGLATAPRASRATGTVACLLSAESPLGPLSPNGTAEGPGAAGACGGVHRAWERAASAEARWELRSARPDAVCEHWQVVQRYDFTQGSGVVRMALRLHRSLCSGATVAGGVWSASGTGCALLAVHVMLATFAAADAALHIAGRRRRAAGGYYYSPLPAADPHSPRAAEGSPSHCSTVAQGECAPAQSPGGRTRRRQSRAWRYTRATFAAGDMERVAALPRPAFALCTDLVVIVSRGLCIAATTQGLSEQGVLARDATCGLSGLLVCIEVVLHLTYFRFARLFPETLWRGLPVAANQLVGVLPLFFAYGVLGTHLFGGFSERFASLGISLVSLFSVMNGDEIRDTFSSVYPNQGVFMQFLSRVYLFSFTCLAIWCIVCSFLAILEEAYFSAKADLLLDLEEDSFRETRRLV